jgi:hypothetical protein
MTMTQADIRSQIAQQPTSEAGHTIAGELEPKRSSAWAFTRTDVEVKCWLCGRWFRALKFRGFWYLRCSRSDYCLDYYFCSAPEELCYEGLKGATWRHVPSIVWQFDGIANRIERKLSTLRRWIDRVQWRLRTVTTKVGATR